MKKSHRVAHEKSEAWWVLLILLYNFLSYCQDFFCKKSVKKSTTPLCSLWYLFVIHSIIVTDSAFSFDLWYRQCAKRKQPMKSRSKSLCCCFRSAYVSVRIVQLPKRGLDLTLHPPRFLKFLFMKRVSLISFLHFSILFDIIICFILLHCR